MDAPPPPRTTSMFSSQPLETRVGVVGLGVDGWLVRVGPSYSTHPPADSISVLSELQQEQLEHETERWGGLGRIEGFKISRACS